MYDSNSDTAKSVIEDWYQTNIVDKGYDSYVSTGIFCEQAKAKHSSSTSGNATMTLYSSYKPNFKCETDGNGKGIINSKVGLITYDEVIYAGGYYDRSNSNYYLYNNKYGIWTMSPSGVTTTYARSWLVASSGRMNSLGVSGDYGLKPVLNLKVNLLVSGTGTSTDPYVVQTN